MLGVLPRDFHYPAADVDVWVPYSTIPDDAIPRLRTVRILDVVARARDGVSREQVAAEMSTITSRLSTEYREDATWGAATVVPLHDALTGEVRTGLLVLLGAVAFVLLIACVNVASLLLARATARGREIAVRAALGASRGRVVRQLLTESLVLAMAGGLAGMLVAVGGVRVLLALGAGQLPAQSDIRLDARVMMFALAVSVITGLLFGLVPALRSSAADLQGDLRSGGRGMTGGRSAHRLRDGLVISEVALAMVLVIGGGLMTRSFMRLLAVDPGFQPDHALVLNFTLSTSRHEHYLQTYQEIVERARAVPGVLAAGSIKDAPMRGVGERSGFTLPGMVIPAGEAQPTAPILHVSDGIFRALGARMLEGREFAWTDRDSTPFVVVVNEAFEKRWFPGERALGKKILFGGRIPVEVVGVVNDIRQQAVAEPAVPTIYVHVLQNGRVRMNLVVRTRGDPMAVAGAVREAVWSVDRSQPITAVFTLQDVMGDALASPAPAGRAAGCLWDPRTRAGRPGTVWRPGVPGDAAAARDRGPAGPRRRSPPGAPHDRPPRVAADGLRRGDRGGRRPGPRPVPQRRPVWSEPERPDDDCGRGAGAPVGRGARQLGARPARGIGGPCPDAS